MEYKSSDPTIAELLKRHQDELLARAYDQMDEEGRHQHEQGVDFVHVDMITFPYTLEGIELVVTYDCPDEATEILSAERA